MANRLPDDKDLQQGVRVSASWMRAIVHTLRDLLSFTVTAPLKLDVAKGRRVLSIARPILRGKVIGKAVNDIAGRIDNDDGTSTPGAGNVKVWRKNSNGDYFETDEIITGTNLASDSVTAGQFIELAADGTGDFLIDYQDCEDS